MNTQQEYKDNLMREYFNPAMIEEAPAGFTEKVMNRVGMEAKPFKPIEKPGMRYIVPVISATVTLILIGIVLLLPAASYEFSGMPWIKMVMSINLPDVKLNLDSLFSFSLPDYLPYLFICILFLTIFDRGLNWLFQRGK